MRVLLLAGEQLWSECVCLVGRVDAAVRVVMVAALTKIKSSTVYSGGSCKCIRLSRIRLKLETPLIYFYSILLSAALKMISAKSGTVI